MWMPDYEENTFSNIHYNRELECFALNFTQSKIFVCDKSFPFSRNVYLKRGATVFLLFFLTTHPPPPPPPHKTPTKAKTPDLMGHGQGEHCMTPPFPPLLLVFHWASGPSLNVVWGIKCRNVLYKIQILHICQGIYSICVKALIKIACDCKYHYTE
jgi:hypothetical protein